MDELTRDAFLGGRLQIRQPAKGYRAGVDPVLLAASVPARAGQSVLELGCGVGVASLCLGWRVPGLALAGLEVQAQYAALARRNAVENGVDLEVVEGDLTAMPEAVRQRQFDHVIANPPYFLRSDSVKANDRGRERALGEVTPLADWVTESVRRVAPLGYVSFVQRAERLPELMTLMAVGLGSLQLLPLVARVGREAQLVLVRGRKGGRAAFRLHGAVVMHAGPVHLEDGDDYAPRVRAVLRHGASLPFE
jgi:tRNA1(Val) A37 N6-methylase TrmN6